MATANVARQKDGSGQDVGNNQGLHNLVEAATALTELVNRIPTSTHTISDDESTPITDVSKKGTVDSEAYSCSNDVSPNPSSKQTSPKASENNKEIFPQRLMHILSQSSISDIITWLPHGRAFVIIRPGELADSILPKYFPESCSSSSKARQKNFDKPSSCKYPSFTRKLNRWGFRLLSRGPDAGAFHHDLFRRDEPELCLQMVCQRSRRRKNNGGVTSTQQASKIRKSAECIKLPTVVPRVSPSSTDSESISSEESPKKKHKSSQMNFDPIAPKTNTTNVTQGRSTPPVSTLAHPVSWQSLSSISAMPSPQIPCVSNVSNATTIGVTSQGAKKSCSPTLPPLTNVLPEKTYLDARALLEHNVALNATIAMAQAANVSQQPQQVQIPDLATFLAQQAATQIQLQSPALRTISGSSSIASSAAPTSTTTSTTTTTAKPNLSLDAKKSKAEEVAANAKSMLYNAYLKALKK